MVERSGAEIDELSPEAREYFELLLRGEGVDLDEGEGSIEPRGAAAIELSFAQQRLWFLSRLEPESAAYNVPAALRLVGSLDVAALALSLGEVVRRHEVLRTAIHTMGGEPLAEVVAADGPFPLPVVDLSGLTSDRRVAEAGGLVDREMLRPFDLAQAPLLRGTLVVLAPADHLVLLTMHHIVSDGWSVGVLVREVGALYEAFSQGRPAPLPPLPIQYADFAAWQRGRLTGDLLDSQLAYWRGRLAGAPPVIPLPSDRPRPPVRDLRGARLPLRLPAALGETVDALGLAEGATPFMTLVAATAAWLHRHGAGEDLVLGSPIANRTRAEIEGLIGFFANTIVLRTDLGGNPSWRDLLARVRETTLGAYEHQDLPFERIVEKLVPERDLSYNPLFQVLVALQNTPVPTLALAGLTLGNWEAELSTARFDLAINLEEERRWDGSVEYAADLFDATTVERMAGHLERLLAAVVEAPGCPLAELPLLSAAERHQLAAEWNDTRRPLPEGGLAHQLFAAQAARTPELPAVVQGSEEVTYRELAARAGQLAAHLRGLGVGPDVLVGVFLERSPDLVVSLLAVLEAGGAYLPLEVSHPRERLSAMLDDARVPLVLTRTRLLPALPEGAPRRLCLDDLRAGGAAAGPAAAPDAANLAYVLYTSGSTGRPKGVAVTHGGLANYLHWAAAAYPAGAGRGAPVHSPVSFDLTVTSLFLPLLSGRRVVLIPEEDGVTGLAAALAEGGFGLVKLTPAHLEVLHRMLPPGRVAGCAEAFVLGGEALSGEQVAFWREHAPDLRLINEYGPTETVVGCCVYEIPASAALTGPVPIGRPIANTRLQILDPRLHAVPPGVPGELYIGGAGVCRGYLHRPDLTAERLIPDPGGARGERLYRTGDLARYRPDGMIDFLGRIDDQVKIRGFRIELGEIEAVLAALPGVREAAVVARGDRSGDRRLVAYVVGDGADIPADALRQSLRERLPGYMVPSAFVPLAELPLTPNGKVDQEALPAPKWQDAEMDHQAPRTPVEEILAGIWGEVLGLEKVGAASHFFDLGGHSLLATRVMSRLHSVFGIEMPLRDLFEAPVLSDLAARIETARLSGALPPAPPLVRVPREGPLPLSFAQQRLWFVNQLEPGSPAYNIPVNLWIGGALDAAALASSLSEVVRRHESLRTTFRSVDDRPVQVVAAASRQSLPRVDLKAIPHERRTAEARRLATEERQRPFDLERGPLVRTALVLLDGEEHALLMSVHHIVADGWSTGVLIQEMAALYSAFAGGRPSPLPELTLQYPDFAVWQRSWLQGEVLAAELAYWKERLAEAPPLNLPTDRPRPAVATFRGSASFLQLSPELSDAIRRFARGQGASLYMALLALWKTLFLHYSGQTDFLVGAGIANRRWVEIEGLIGFFVNTLALRTDLSGDPTFLELVGRVRETTLGAYAHEDLPFEKVVEELHPTRDLSRNPLFQVAVLLQNFPTPDLHLSGLTLRAMGESHETAKFDLQIFMEETPRGILLGAEYATDLFDPTSIARMLQSSFQTLTEAVMADPGRHLAAIPLLRAEERHQLLHEWNDTSSPDPGRLGVHQMIEEQSRRTPGAPAVTFEGRTLTYAELDREANRLARRLRALGCGAETLVAVAMERSFELVIALLGTFKAGAAYVPLDPESPRDRLAFLLEDARPAVLLTQERLLPRLPVPAVPLLLLDKEDLSSESAAPIVEPVDDLQAAYMIYTSGSTGRPKGVTITHRGLANYLLWAAEAYPAGEGRGAPVHSPVSFDLTVTSLFLPLLAGRGVHLVPEEEGVEGLATALTEGGFGLVKLTPAHLEVLHRLLPPERVDGCAEAFVIGGEALFGEQLAFWREHAPGLRLINEYGPTETVVGCSIYEVPASAMPPAGPVPIGRPIARTRILLVDRWLRPVPIGVPGELCIGGTNVGRGYLGRPSLTAEKFIPDPFSDRPGERLYRTGDLARQLPDGTLEFLGRIDHQIKLRGYRIELGEIEATFASHSLVRECVALLREDQPGDPRLVAYVVMGKDQATDLETEHSGHVSHWQELYEDTYSHPADLSNPTLNLAGWNSSYTGEPIPQEEMREWVETTVERIAALRPRRVLEIGCGMGLLLFRIAPACERYVGVDFSRAALDFVARQLAGLPQVELLQRTADDVSDFAPGSFDLVVINSVVQYFPDVEYLVRVVTEAARVVAPGGALFLGDILSLPLQKALAASIELARSSGPTPVSDLRRRIHSRVLNEEELLIAPAFFTALAGRVPGVAGARIEVKRGIYRNELTGFRYDATVRIGAEPEGVSPLWRRWNEDRFDLAVLRDLLVEEAPEALGISGVPNARLRRDIALWELLESSDAPATAEEVRGALAAVEEGVDPEELWRLGTDLGYEVEVGWSGTGDEGALDAVFHRPGVTLRPRTGTEAEIEKIARPWTAFANNPLAGTFARSLVPALRAFAQETLPEYAVPSTFVLLESLPLTPNGKVDRKALPAPERQGPETAYAAPRDPVEELLAGIWSEILGVERVGIHDNFFDLGGHSLLATQVSSRIRSSLHLEMPVRRLFEHPTVAALAASLRSTEGVQGGDTPPIPPIIPVPRDRSLPLSFAQQRLWFIDQLEPGSPIYNVPAALRIEGPLEGAALARSLGEIVRRHEALRTVFAATEGSPVQVIRPAEAFPLPLVDLAGLPEDAREALVLTLIGEEAVRAFDLTRGPLLRALLLRLTPGDHALALTMHHIASDGWSMGLLVREVTALYAAFAAGRPSPLPELPVQYADFAVWQSSWLQGEVLEREIAFWRRQLAGLPPLLELPTDRPRPAVQSFRGATRPVRLSAGLKQQLEALGRREGATLFMVLLAGFQALLAHHSGQQDLAVGSPVAGRNRVEIEGLIGFFVNTLVLRGDLTGEPSFRELLGRVRETALSADTHQNVPFERLVQELSPERSLAQTPLFQVMLALQEAAADSLESLNLRLRPLGGAGTAAKFDLTLSLEKRDGGLRGTLEHATDLFDATTIDRLIGHFERLLTAVVAEPEPPVSKLPLLFPSERHQLLVEWNDTAGPRSRESILHRLFEAQAARTPDEPAAVFQGETLTYAELDARADRLARRLRGLGCGPESLVGVALERSLGLIVALLGVLKAGAAYVPLDPEYPRERLAFVLEDAAPQVLITETPLLAALPPAPGMVLCLDRTPLDGGRTGRGSMARDQDDLQLAYVLYTSGSTGRPKGVGVPHRALINFLGSMRRTPGFSPGERLLAVTSLSFDIAGLEIFLPLTSGGCVEVAGRRETTDGALLAARLRASGADVLQATPATWRMLLDAGWTGDPGLRALCGGEALPRELAASLAGHTRELWNLYGPTETTVWSAIARIRPEEIGPVSIGRPIAETRLRILDPRLRPVPIGAAGELCIGGEGVCRGYLHRPGLTAERFIPDPGGSWGERLYRTGDLVRYRPDGTLDFLGRIDHQVKIRGFRIELGEIEAVLAAAPGVRQAVVAAREARSGMPGNRRLVAYVVGDATADALRRSLREQLPEYMVPAAFVQLEEMPLTPNGKVDRKALPAPEEQAADEGYLAPRTPVEEILAGIWAGLLGRERVGAGDQFFDLGGHSLLATQVMSRLRDAFDVEMPLRDLFEAPRLADLAARVEARIREDRRAGAGRIAPPLVPVPREGALPLSFAQQRLWLIDQLDPDSPLYNLPMALRVEGPLSPAVLARCLGEIVRRHEALRTVFIDQDGAPAQVIRPAAPFELPVVDLSALPESRREAAALTLAGAEAVLPFDLTRGPLLRGVVLRLAAEDHVAALTVHHIVSDGWSMGILVREIAALYAAFAAERPSPLPELPVQYADFAAWQHSWLHGEVLEGEIAFWRRQLADLPPRLELSTDRPRPAVQSFRGATRPVRLSPELTRRVQALSRHERATSFIVLLAAFQALLSRYSRQKDLAVGTPVAGRNRVEIEGSIGFFVNTLVLRGDLEGEPSFRELLARVRDTALAAHAHQDVPFEKLVQELSPERSLAQTPLFQVVFNLQNAPVESLDIESLRLRPVSGTGTTAKFDLTFTLAEWEGGLSGTMEHATDLFDATTADRLVVHYERLLTAALAAPELAAAKLPLLSEAERHQAWAEWNDTVDDPARAERCLHELFAERAAAEPGRTALLFGGESMTYGELDRRSNQLAHHLRRRGAVPGTLVGVCLAPSFETVIALLAIHRTGGAYVPLDPAYPAERLALLVESTPLVITREETREKLPPGVRLVFVDTEEREIAEQSAHPVDGGAKPGDIAYIIYTSGSTGRPKGVVIDHRGAVNTILDINRRFGVGPEDRVLALSSLSFDLSVWDIFGLLAAGGAVVLLQSAERREPALWAELLVRHRVTIWNSVPALVEMLVEHAASRPGFAAPDLRLVMMSGDWIPVSLPRRIRGLGAHPADLEIISMGGATEASIWSILYPIRQVEPGWPSIPYGRPMVNQAFHVLDDALEPQPIGVPGQLFIGGIGVALEYWGDEEKTRASFLRRPGPLPGGGERLYRTGDLGRRLPDGTIEFLGRVDHQVKIRGFRIELGDIEAALAAVPGVREALVAVREDTPGDRRLVAYVIGDAETDTLYPSLRDRLPDYMVPAAFVKLEALPLTPNGKVDRKALPAPEWQGAGAGESYLAPQTPVEKLLAGIWSDLLGIERIGVDESFFDLGGHSLLATRMVSQLRDLLRLEVPLRTVFEAPTVAELARRVTALQSEKVAEALPIRPVPRDGELPLSYAQQRLWFLDQMVPDNPFYNIYNPVELSGPMDVEVLRRSFEEIVRRHEVLRTTFGAVDGRPVQVIAPTARLELPLIDLAGLGAGERRRELSRLSREEGSRPFVLSRGPLLRLHVVRIEPERHALLVTLHHIAADGWSMRVLIDELTMLYEAFLEGRPSPLPELPIQYADFAVWQRQWFQGEVFQEQLSYWKSRLAGLVEAPLELPTDHPRPPIETFRGQTELFRLEAPLVRELSALARRHQATLFMVVLSGFKSLLSRYSGQQDIGIGTGIANRNRQEIEDLIGFFVNTLVLRTELSGLPSFDDLLLRVRQTTVESYDHQDLPFEMLIEEINPERSMNRHPLVQVMLAFQNFPRSARSLRGLSLTDLEGELAQVATAKFDMSLFVTEPGEHLALALQYSTDLFEVVTVRRMLGHLEGLLWAAVERPETPVAELPLLSAAERLQTLREWSDTEKPCPQVPLVHELFAEHARQRPKAPAVTSWDGGRLTYGEVEARANRLAHHLRSLGVGPEVRVAVAAERTCERVVGIVAVLKAGGAYVTLDPGYPKERLAWLLADAGAPVLLTLKSVVDQLPETQAAVICLDGEWESIVGREDRAPESGVLPENLAYVVYTSGSTGKPKGVEIPHAGLMNLVRWHCDLYQVKPEDRGTQIASPAFDASIWELWPYLAGGASVHIPDEETRLSPRGMIRWWAEQQITLAYLMTPLAEGVLEEEIPPGLELPTRALIIGGDRLHRGPLPGVGFRLMNHYGPAEYSVTSTVVEVPPRGESTGIPTIGRAVDNTLLYVLDRRSGQPMPVGVPGELYVAGVGLARGYSGRPELTAEKFVPDPFAEEPGSRMYRTGDLVKWLPDGDLDFLGRLDHQVKIRGFRIELGEIETVLAEHPAVTASAALALQEPSGQVRLVAYVVYDREAEEAASEVSSSISQQVTDWQTLYDNTYERGRSAEEASFNIVGWDSSYTRELIPAEEMLEWTERTVEEILALAPKRVLEIGVGTGLLLYRVAPRCELYRGTDFSHQVIDWLSGQLGASLPQVELARRTADDFSGVAPRSFDTVVLNSVVQYFPDAGYLAQVLTGAVEAVADGGAVYVGDVRSLPLLEAFHASVELFKADPALPLERLRQVAAAQRLEETELVLDPGFFFALRNRLPRITAVEVRPKRDRADNELSRFRYQVVLRVGGETPAAPTLPWLDWEQEGLSLAEVRRHLETEPEGLALARVPNVRVEEPVAAARALAGAGVGDGPRTAGELRARLDRLAPSGAHPGDLLALAEEMGYAAVLSWARPGADGRFDVLFRRPQASQACGIEMPGPAVDGPWSRFANNPLLGKLARRLTPVLRAHAEERLPAYMVPSAFVVLDELPLTPNGKVDRRALPAPEAARQDGPATLPRTPAEEKLAAVFREVLQIERLGVEDDFFALGGHSLLATQIVTRVREAFGVELPVRAVFEDPSVATLAARIESMAREAEGPRLPPLERVPRQGPLPLSFAQERLWVLDQLDPGRPTYNVPSAVLLEGALDVAALAGAFTEVVARHEVLRTAFDATESGPVQWARPARPFSLPVIDLLALPAAERQREALRLADAEAQRPFDLAAGLLLRAALVRTEAEAHVALLTLHHIASDARSMEILLRELHTLYTAFTAGAPSSPLPELPLQYADYAVWQRGWLTGEPLEAQLSYWHRRLSGAPPVVELPLDRPRPARQTFDGATLRFDLPAELSARVDELSQSRGATLFMGLLAAFAALLGRSTGQTDVSIGTPVSGRDRIELENLIGFFLNTLVLRVGMDTETGFRNLLDGVRELSLEAFAHQDLPFEKLVDELQPTRSLTHSPLFQVMFVLVHVEDDGAAAPGGLRLRSLPSTSNSAKFDLTLFLFAHAGGLAGSLEYNTGLFDAPTIDRMAGHFTNLLQSLVEQPAAPLATLPLFGAAERHQLLSEWSGSAAVLRQLAEEDGRRGAALPPFAATENYVLDRHLEPVPIGVPGELFLGGDGLTPEALEQLGMTEERLVPHPSGVPGRHLYRTGERVRRRADGSLDFRVDLGALPATAGAVARPKRHFVAPRTAAEEVMAGLWAEILGVERVGIQDNFFTLGGHSLLATRLMMKLRSVFGVEVALRALFEGPTVEEACAAFALAAGGMEVLEEIAQVYQEVASLSEEEIAEMLSSQEGDAEDGHGSLRAGTYS